jgi:hypothetical protein
MWHLAALLNAQGYSQATSLFQSLARLQRRQPSLPLQWDK